MFPLLHLPRLAVQQVIRIIGLNEIFFLSLLSNRAKKVIQSSIRKNSMHIVFELSAFHLKAVIDYFYINVSLRELKSNVECTEIRKLGPETYRLFGDSHGRTCQMEPLNDSVDSRKRFSRNSIHHCVETFNNPIVSMTCDEQICEEFACEMICYFKEQDIKMRSIKILANLSSDGCREVMDACSSIQDLRIGSSVPTDFQYTPSKVITTESIHISANAPWMMLEDFMHCKSFRFLHSPEVNNARMTPEYLNKFLKKLIATDCKLKYLSVTFDTPELFPRVVEGLSDRPIGQDKSVKIHAKNGRSYIVELGSKTLLIQRMSD